MSADLFGRRIEIEGMEVLYVVTASQAGPDEGPFRLAVELIVREIKTANGKRIPTTAEQVASALIALGWTPPAGDR